MSYQYHINATSWLDAKHSIRWYQLSSQIFLNSLLTHFSLKFILPSMVPHRLVLGEWLDFRLPLCWLRKGGSSNNVTCLLWLDFFPCPITYLPSLGSLASSGAAHGPTSLSGPFIPTTILFYNSPNIPISIFTYNSLK